MEELMLINPEDSGAKSKKVGALQIIFSKAYLQDRDVLNASKDALAHAFI